MGKDYVPLKDLEVYQLARELSRKAWAIYEELSWKDQKIMGDQFIESADSVGGNIAEGYARYHFRDRVKFYYYSRGSLSESCNHWLELLYERKRISYLSFKDIKDLQRETEIKLNNFISSTMRNT
ncbi:MAG: four helix bundle protein [Phaeodactylibacter sp.]|nr:four helix bundle protein [Phaeodactylibacter sp.]